MDKYILRVSLLRVVNKQDQLVLDKKQKEQAIDKYNEKADKFWCNAVYDGVGYKIVDNLDCGFAMRLMMSLSTSLLMLIKLVKFVI